MTVSLSIYINQMSNRFNDVLYEDKLIERAEWLSEHSMHDHTYTEADVMRDDEGEYIMTRNDLGGFDFEYLPEELRTI